MYRIFCIASFVITIALSSSPAQSDWSGEIYNLHTNQCLQPAYLAAGAPIVQEPCTSAFAQQWYALSAGGSIVNYQNAGNGMWLDARGPAANGTPVQLWTYGRISNENWQQGNIGKGAFPPLISRVSGTSSYCLDVPGGQMTEGLAMQIYTCNGTLSQEWWIAAQLPRQSSKLRILGKTIETVPDSIAGGIAKASIEQPVAQLVDYAKVPFAGEQWMGQYCYPEARSTNSRRFDHRPDGPAQEIAGTPYRRLLPAIQRNVSRQMRS